MEIVNERKIKNGIDDFIGKERMFTPGLKSKILSNVKSPKNRVNRSFNFRPLLNIAAIIIVFGVAALLLLSQESDQQSASEIEKVEKENKDLRFALQNSESQNEVLKEQLAAMSLEVENAKDNKDLDVLSELELERMGFQGTAADIAAELVKHPEIIPYEGILGGTTTFSEDGIKVFSHKWIYAPFSDGHFVGALLLKYEIKDGKATNFKIVDTFMAGEEE